LSVFKPLLAWRRAFGKLRGKTVEGVAAGFLQRGAPVKGPSGWDKARGRQSCANFLKYENNS
jgi:hypothetical protein